MLFYPERLLFGPAGGLWEMWSRAIRAERWGVWVTPSLTHHPPLVVGCFQNTNCSPAEKANWAGLQAWQCAAYCRRRRGTSGACMSMNLFTHVVPQQRGEHIREQVFSGRTSAEINRRTNVNP